MQIRIRGRKVRVTKVLRAHVERRLGFALGRFGEHVGRVVVHLSKSEERLDREEKRCRIAVALRRHVRVQETDADLFAAVDRAADRAARSVAHAIEREHEGPDSASPTCVPYEPRSLAASPLAALRVADTMLTSGLKRRYSSAPPGK